MRTLNFNSLNLLSDIRADYKLFEPQKVIVISAQNFCNGGPWTLLNDVIFHICTSFPDFLIISIVSQPSVHHFSNLIHLIEPFSKSSWFVRLLYEKLIFRFFSSSLGFPVDLWISLHDVTSYVVAKRQITYFHNPAPFWSPNLLSLYLAPSLAFFKLFYLFVCRSNISRNYVFVVQQYSLANQLYSRLRLNNIVILPPRTSTHISSSTTLEPHYSSLTISSLVDQDDIYFFCPVTPRVFKNIELAMSAFAKLPAFKLVVTISRDQNRYTKHLHRLYSKYTNILFVGYQTSSNMRFLYRNCRAVIFPSLLETWGLPLTEARSFNKDIFAPDLPYVYETLPDYPNLYTYVPNSIENFLQILIPYLNAGPDSSVSTSTPFKYKNTIFPSFASWKSLIDYILS